MKSVGVLYSSYYQKFNRVDVFDALWYPYRFFSMRGSSNLYLTFQNFFLKRGIFGSKALWGKPFYRVAGLQKLTIPSIWKFLFKLNWLSCFFNTDKYMQNCSHQVQSHGMVLKNNEWKHENEIVEIRH